jgi:hypothetical protein
MLLAMRVISAWTILMFVWVEWVLMYSAVGNSTITPDSALYFFTNLMAAIFE